MNFYKIKMIKYTKNFSNINHQGKVILRDPIQLIIWRKKMLKTDKEGNTFKGLYKNLTAKSQ